VWRRLERMKFPLFLVFIAGCATPSYVDAQAPRSPTPQSIAAPVRVETVAEGLEHPWAL